tara:strand:- start:287 stop:553 length:267 start_codon:yes stop_codon:yes gene_type:complete
MYKHRDVTEYEDCCLNLVEKRLDDGLTSYVLVDSENIYDEESDEVWRRFTFEVGIKRHVFVISPNKEIKYFEFGVPQSLCDQILECLR